MTVQVGLDDLYLPTAGRQLLARNVHPLFAVRGVPGTHDIAAGIRILDALGGTGSLALPAFDKAKDDPVPHEDWRMIDTPVDIVLFEGWCFGARPQDAGLLSAPINGLERDEDPDAVWRRHVIACLAGQYQAFFSKFGMLVLLQAPGFEVVAEWRLEQEETLRRALASEGRDVSGLMDRKAIKRFVMFYERITRHILEEMPARADLVIELDAQRRPVSVKARN
ncbi:MAG: kinase [Novosphingobium sp.]